MDERTLVQRLQAGDESAFETIYQHYIHQAVRTAYLVTRNQQAAEDVAQEAFVQVLRKTWSLRDPSGFRSWFYAILLNGARRSMRKGRGWFTLPFDLLRRERPDELGPAPDEALVGSEEAAAVRQGLALLPESHRVPLILRYYAELTEPEIALAMGLPLGTVKSRLHHARQKLQRLLAAEPAKGGEALAKR